jgi:hypothetical protein
MKKKVQERYFQKIGMSFYDVSTSQNFKITGIYVCPSGLHAGPQTPLYYFYDTTAYPGGLLSDGDFEYQPCSEVLRSRDIQ